MNARRYRVRKDRDAVAAAYALTAIAQLAEDYGFPKEAREWAQGLLDEMVDAGDIEPKGAVQP